MDERKWIHAIQNGNKKYLQDIAEKYYDDIFRFCAFQTGSREDACDMAQETFLRFIRYVENYRHGNLKGYLLTVAANVCRDFLAKRAREAALTVAQDATGKGDLPEGYPEEAADLADMRTPERQAFDRDRSERLSAALSGLPQMQREAVVLYYISELKYREIAKLTGVSIPTVKSRVRQGVQKLQAALCKEDFL